MTSRCASEPAPSRRAATRLRRAQPLLGTLVELTVWHAEAGAAARACDAAFAAVAEIDALMSFHRGDSELSRLNRAPPGVAVDLTPHTWRVLVHAARMHRASAGLFDCAIAPRLQAEGFLPGCAGARAAGATQADVLLPAPGRAVKRRAVRLDLGGIAKGYAVDRAVAALRAAGASAGSVNAGGDIRVFGRRPVRIEVRHPSRPECPGACIALRSAAVATTAGYFGRRAAHPGAAGQRAAQASRWQVPVVDPRTGACVTMDASVTVAAPQCVLADALTKVIALSGDAAHPLLARFRAEAWILPAVPPGSRTCADALR